ncbi:MAG: glycosyltransferase family 2 protein [Faecousia sp.]
MPQISVIVPVYRAEKFLGRCVDSVLNQTFRDYELLLLDDGSPDSSGEICDAYAARDSRVRVIHQKNAGVCAARNTCLDWVFSNSDSQWIFFIDNDDWMHPETLERLYRAAQEQGTKIAVCGYAQTAGEDPAVSPEQLIPERWPPKDFYMERFINATVCWGKLYHRSCFDGQRYPAGKHMEDEFLTYRLLFAQDTLTVIPAPLYAYYYNPAGITKSAWTPGRLDAWEAYEQQISFFKLRNDEELVRFRYRGYLENAVANLTAARQAENAQELTAQIRRIEGKIRSLLRRCRKQGCLEFWPDFDLLYEFYPLRTRLYRLYLELRGRFGGKKDA